MLSERLELGISDRGLVGTCCPGNERKHSGYRSNDLSEAPYHPSRVYRIRFSQRRQTSSQWNQQHESYVNRYSCQNNETTPRTIDFHSDFQCPSTKTSLISSLLFARFSLADSFVFIAPVYETSSEKTLQVSFSKNSVTPFTHRRRQLPLKACSVLKACGTQDQHDCLLSAKCYRRHIYRPRAVMQCTEFEHGIEER